MQTWEMNNDTIRKSDLCESARSIMTSKELRFTQILECIFGLSAIVPNMVALFLLWRVNVFHCNLRLLLANYSLVLAVYPVTIAVDALRFLISPICDLPMLLRPCVVQDMIMVIPLHNSVITMFTICIERLYATLRYKTYESNKGAPYLALFLIIAGWSATFGMNVTRINSVPENIWVPICQWALFLGSQKVAPSLISLIVIEASSLTITVFVYMYNRFLWNRMVINRAKFDLSARFQVDQNLKLSAALLPSDLLHVLSYLPSYIFLISTIFNPLLSLKTQMWIVQFTFVYRMAYASVHPILLITRNPSMRRGAVRTPLGRVCAGWMAYWRNCGKETKTNDLQMRTTANKMDIYFSQLEQHWSVEHTKRNMGTRRKSM